MGDETIDRVLHDLRVISAIREGDKIYTDGGLLNLDHGGYTSGACRWARGETRAKGVSAISNTLSDALAIAEHSFRRIEGCESINRKREISVAKLKSYHLIKKIRTGIADITFGLKNLRTTYNTDTSLIAKVDVMQERVKQTLRELDVSIEYICEHNHDLATDCAQAISPRISECAIVHDMRSPIED